MEPEERLRRRRERDRQRRAQETAEQREARLSRHRERERAIRVAENQMEREARLSRRRERERTIRVAENRVARRSRCMDRDRTAHQIWRDTETPEARQVRLQGDAAAHQIRRDTETPEARQVCLQGDAAAHQVRRSQATPEATQEYLHQCRQRYHAQRDVDSQAPLFHQPMVHSKMLNFHSKLTSLEFHHCTTCLERFPDLTMSASGTECRRCSGDKRVPKLYSAANNMNPGPVPPQLQGLTQVEQMLVSAVMPVMSIYRLPLGQYGYTGHVIKTTSIHIHHQHLHILAQARPTQCFTFTSNNN